MSAQPTILRATNSADFLAALPRLTGMRAPESLFVVLFDGKRTLGAARVDLPERLGEQLENPGPELATWLKAVAGLALKGDSAVIVIDTASRLTKRPEQSPHGVLTAVLANALRAAGVSLKDALVVGSDGWASFADGAERPDLNWLEDITQSPLHDPDHETVPLDEWRAEHPGKTAESPDEIDELAARMCASGSKENRA